MKGKFNIKGFAARIDHNLGRKNGDGVKFLTKMINTDLIRHWVSINIFARRKYII